MNEQIKEIIKEKIDHFNSLESPFEREKSFKSIANWLKSSVSDMYYSEWVALRNSEPELQEEFLNQLLNDLNIQR